MKLNFLTLLLSLITAKRQLVHNRTASRSHWNQSYDFIVVGAGTAGCPVAHRLAESGKLFVLLLEAGGAQDAIYNDIPTQFGVINSERPDLQWNYLNQPQTNVGLQYNNRQIPEPLGKTIGGSSSHNGMIFNRGNARGFNEWQQKYGAKGWNFRRVLPFFKKFENNLDPRIVSKSPGYHGTDGPVQITTPKETGTLPLMKHVYNSLGFMDTDINGPKQNGTMIIQSFIGHNGLRSSAGTAYVDPNPYPKNLHIVTKALVTKILFNDLTAVGVEFERNNQSFKVYARKEIIISAGAINSPQLLMLSGVGPKTHLSSFNITVLTDLPVGKNYANHPQMSIKFSPAPSLTSARLSDLYFRHSGVLSEAATLMTYFSTKSNKDKEWPNVAFSTYLNPLNNTLNTLFNLFRTRSKGTIRLQSSSPFTPPLITTNFLSDPQDFENAVEATKFLFYVLERPSLSHYAIVPTFEGVGCPSCPNIKNYLCDEGIRCFIRFSITSGNHPGGSCRMGAAYRDDVVVDPLLRVKHIKNLRVCDTSIFPELPNGNTYASALMVGEKCAHIIKKCYHLS